MNTEVLQLLNLVQQSESLTAKEKIVLSEFVSGSEKEMETILSKLKRAEKAKSAGSILLEQTIAELEQKRKAVEVKNRELEIEAALEKVRSQAMNMRKPDDLLGICKALFTALNTIGFNELRNTMINIHDDDKGSFLNYDFSHAAGPTVTNIIYTSHPVIENLVNLIRSAATDFAEFVISGSELDKWRVYRKTMGEKDDPRLDNVTALSYYFHTIENGAIGISTYSGITEEKRNVLKRFGNVFELAYRRYIDIKQAEIQAREAKIEVALERVRSKTMAMHKSTDLLDVITILAEQFQLLGFKIHSANFNTSYREKDWNLWLYNPGAPLYPEQIRVPYLDHPFFNRTLKSIANGSDFNSFIFTKEEKNAFLDHLYTNTIAKNTSEERKIFTYNKNGLVYNI